MKYDGIILYILQLLFPDTDERPKRTMRQSEEGLSPK